MEKCLVTVEPETPIKEAAHPASREKKYGCVAVVRDED
jgi:hypothetical protein